MKIFKELKKLGYIHYSATTIEELDDLPLNSAERISEQALVLRWFREKYCLYFNIHRLPHKIGTKEEFMLTIDSSSVGGYHKTYEQAELECLKKLIRIVKEKQHEK
jgi:hypothetical protein